MPYQRYKLVDPSLVFVDASEEELKSLWKSYYPAGSGSLSEMREICGLIESIAHLRGFDPAKWINNDA